MVDHHGRSFELEISRPGKWQVLALLMLVGVLNYVDRLSMAVLQVPIKQELGLSDTQLGAITGVSFALVYTMATIPIAGLADRYSRRFIIVLSLTVWSLMTLLCGLAGGFAALALFRMGVALGEAGCSPAALALMSDYFAPSERPRAFAFWQLAFPLGTMLGIGGGGLAIHLIGWRNTFFLLGAIGLILAPVVWVLLKDPRESRPSVARTSKAPGLLSGMACLWASAAFRRNILGGALLSYAYQAILNWGPPLYTRAFAMPVKDAATYVAMMIGVGGAAGILLASILAGLPGRRDVRWYFWIPTLVSLLFVPALLVQCFAESAAASLWIGLVPVILFNSMLPSWIACGQLLAPPGHRAMAAALQTFACGIIGGAGGPFLTGVISDLLTQRFSMEGDALRWAVASSALPALAALFVFLSGASKIVAETPTKTAARADNGRSKRPPRFSRGFNFLTFLPRWTG